jgi:hypothetical protein
MDTAKYIVVEIFCGIMKMETPILFPAYVGHDDMARALSIAPDDVLGAGFVEIHPSRESLAFGELQGLFQKGDSVNLDYQITVKAYGSSTSLGVSSRKEDSTLIRKALNIPEDRWGS